jgi:hypothetical protein
VVHPPTIQFPFVSFPFLSLTEMLFLCFFISSITGIELDVMKQICFHCQEEVEVEVGEVVKKYAKPHKSFQESGASQSTQEISETGIRTAWTGIGIGIEIGAVVGTVFGSLALVVLVFALLWIFFCRNAANKDSLVNPKNVNTSQDCVVGFENSEPTSSNETVDGEKTSSDVNFQDDAER